MYPFLPSVHINTIENGDGCHKKEGFQNALQSGGSKIRKCSVFIRLDGQKWSSLRKRLHQWSFKAKPGEVKGCFLNSENPPDVDKGLIIAKFKTL